MQKAVKREYAIYDTENNDQLLGVFSSKEAAEYLGCALQTLYGNITTKRLFQRRYEVIKIHKDKE